MQCINHPRIDTVLRCGKCDRPICGKCMVPTPVGARCKECAHLRRLPTYTLPPLIVLRGGAAGLGAGAALGVGMALLLSLGLVPWPLAGWLPVLGLVASAYLVGEAVSLATNRKRGMPLQLIAVAGFLLSYLLLELLTPGSFLGSLYVIIALIIGAAIAVARMR
ncbi:MAG: hypothetical protein HY686_08810 [Chloroflexi bacterium]|nr:hypothetical protein [Chloroflexota bacterium]